MSCETMGEILPNSGITNKKSEKEVIMSFLVAKK
jgi:hypothetical protein